MRAGGMLCRSQAATAVCVPGDARSMVVARRAADRTRDSDDARALHDVRYARLGAGAGDGGRRTSASRRFSAPSRAAAPPPTATAATASCKPRVERPRRAPVAVTLPMVTKSPSKEAPPKDLAAAAKRAQAAAVAAPPGDQLLQFIRRTTLRVTSFSIDLESKKVTVMGHVSPAGVLESISKVKKAELLLA
ncbi:Heavy metal transport/detoxification superfamily protein [Zea mays]|uniref:Heavy metal transport/detoxification superfamily protein n=1 Tax=Zea mays TaxID=4577 RepID=A0A1D6Q0R5_MAIZE|nr:Heavy metal transport/detoxification superfamily protein [Zea mays]